MDIEVIYSFCHRFNWRMKIVLTNFFRDMKSAIILKFILLKPLFVT